MEMEDHHQYGMPDLRHLLNGSAQFPVIPQQTQLFSSHRSLTAAQQMEMMMIPPQLHEFGVDSANNTNTDAAPPTTSANNTINISTLGGLEAETGWLGGDGGTARWPRQETLALLEIRSHLDNKFKEANQKGPLWDEVSRIMSEEHGYQRSGKKCREKFENLYKYYKKTKEGKAGKNYRFFRQLEALCGETSNPISVPETHLAGDSLQFHSATKTFTQATQEAHQAHKHCDCLSLSNSSEFDTSSSDDNYLSAEGLTENDSVEKRRKRRGSKAKITDFIDSQMMKLMEKQEAWLEKMMRTLDQKEQERLIREEEWRKQDAARIDREHKFWVKERAWIEARDAALMEAFQKLTGRELSTTTTSSPEEKIASEIQNHTENHENSREKDKCESINNYLRKVKKRKENSRGSCFFENNGDDTSNQRGSYNCEEQETVRIGQSDVVSSSPSNSNARNGMPDRCFRFLMGDGENLWENYGLNLNKGENH